MALTAEQLGALCVILRACASECFDSPLGNLLEGHLKVVAADALLRAGYSIMESANIKRQGRVVSLENGVLSLSLEDRPHMPAAVGSGKAKNSPDLRVWQPCRLIVELQVRTVVGSQSAIFSDNLADDIERVRRHSADVLVLAADQQLYDSLRGLKQDLNRTRFSWTLM